MIDRLPPWAGSFLERGADRLGVLEAAIESDGVRCSRFEPAGGGRFLIAYPKAYERDELYRLKLFTAHHDRVSGTSGALDNSAACMQLARYLRDGRAGLNVVVVFTDREELQGADPTEQGSFLLGSALSSLGLKRPLVFSFDVTGRGDTMVVSAAARSLRSRGRAWERLAAEVDELAVEADRALAAKVRHMRAYIPFGEDLGFMRAGVPALGLTVLPRDEAEALGSEGGLPAWASTAAPRRRRPPTWRVLHTEDDKPSLYDEEAFALMERALEALGTLRVPARA